MYLNRRALSVVKVVSGFSPLTIAAVTGTDIALRRPLDVYVIGIVLSR